MTVRGVRWEKLSDGTAQRDRWPWSPTHQHFGLARARTEQVTCTPPPLLFLPRGCVVAAPTEQRAAIGLNSIEARLAVPCPAMPCPFDYTSSCHVTCTQEAEFARDGRFQRNIKQGPSARRDVMEGTVLGVEPFPPGRTPREV